MLRLSKRFVILLTVVTALFAGAAFAVPPAAPAPAKWETIRTISADQSEEQIDMRVDGNYVYVFTPKATNVKMFTILGQLVSQASLPAGTSRFKVATRGIYILKIGTTTRRITI